MKGFVHAELSESDSEREMSKGNFKNNNNDNNNNSSDQRNTLIEESFEAEEAKQIRVNHQETMLNSFIS